jgi:methionyl-tRNA formyltransferase
LLPKYRGAAPIQRAIMACETTTGVTTMWMDATLETGDMLLSASLPIEPDDTAGTLTPKLADVGAHLLVETLEGLAAGTLTRRKQDDAQATFAPALKSEDGEVRWGEPATAICCRIRGVSPKPGAFAVIKGRRVKLWQAETINATASGSPGAVVEISKAPSGVVVTAADGTAVRILEAQPNNGKRMNAADWARGLRLMPGDRFDVTPVEN